MWFTVGGGDTGGRGEFLVGACVTGTVDSCLDDSCCGVGVAVVDGVPSMERVVCALLQEWALFAQVGGNHVDELVCWWVDPVVGFKPALVSVDRDVRACLAWCVHVANVNQLVCHMKHYGAQWG